MNPQISVIVPVYNPAAVFDESLDSIAAACRAVPDQVEVLIIDDCSDQPFAGRVESRGFRYERMPQHSGAGATRNQGAQLAAGGIVLFIDYDIIVPPDSFQQVLDHFDRDQQLTALSARPAIGNGSTVFFNTYKCLFSYNLFNRTPERICYLWTSFSAVRADAFQSAGGFPTRYKYATWEDVEMGLRLASLGYRLINTSRIEVVHKHYYGLSSLIRNDWRRAADYMKLLIHNRVVIRQFKRDGLSLQHHEKLAVLLSVLVFIDLLIVLGAAGGLRFSALGIGPLIAVPILLLLLILSLRGSLALAWRTYGAVFAAKSLLTSLVLSNIQALAALSGLATYLLEQTDEPGEV